MPEQNDARKEVSLFLQAQMQGFHRTHSWPWPCLSRQSKSLMPGSTTLLCGDPGSTKSFLLLQSLIHWHNQHVPAKMFVLEEDRRFHLLRLLALAAGTSRLLDDDWVRNSPDQVKTLFNEHQDILDEVGPLIHAPDSTSVSLSEVSEWLETEASRGARILAVDPITMADDEGLPPWEASRRFMGAVKRTASSHGCSIVLVTHPRKGRMSQSIGMDDLAGGAAYVRIASAILWIERIEPVTKTMTVDGKTEQHGVNRILHIRKARSGQGTGLKIGMWFEPTTLKCKEIGLIVRKTKT